MSLVIVTCLAHLKVESVNSVSHLALRVREKTYSKSGLDFMEPSIGGNRTLKRGRLRIILGFNYFGQLAFFVVPELTNLRFR
jgi:hypothetical protein